MHNFHQLPRLVKSLHVTLVPDGEAPPLELEILEKEAETGGSTRDGKWISWNWMDDWAMLDLSLLHLMTSSQKLSSYIGYIHIYTLYMLYIVSSIQNLDGDFFWLCVRGVYPPTLANYWGTWWSTDQFFLVFPRFSLHLFLRENPENPLVNSQFAMENHRFRWFNEPNHRVQELGSFSTAMISHDFFF